jgi:chromosome segregation ATPase
MDLEQIGKRVTWLDDERRKDKTALASIEDRLESLDNNVQSLLQQMKEMSSDVTRLKSLSSRVDSIEDGLLKQKKEAKKLVDDLDKELQRRNDEGEKVKNVEMSSIDASLSEIHKELLSVQEVKKVLQARSEEDLRTVRLMDELKEKVNVINRSEDEFTHQFRLIEDGRRQDAKRMTDIQGELSALRKRSDEFRTQMELTGTAMRKLESRVGETETSESERKKAQTKSLEEAALVQVERERLWKEWQTKINTIEKQTVEIEATLQTLDSTNRTVMRTQQVIEELSQKIERRITEMTEIQRLADERFRQEWVTFKADDQKRWTNYTLMQDEQRSDISRQNERLNERLTIMEDSMQDVHDILQLTNELTEKRLQGLLASVHEWVSLYEHNFGRQTAK